MDFRVLGVTVSPWDDLGASSAKDKTPLRKRQRPTLPKLPRVWWDGDYQAANRLAHLYFLREVCAVDAHLAFIDIVDNPTYNPTAQ